MKKTKRNAGLTLIEIIIAIAILGIITVALSNLFIFSFDTIFSSGNKTVATKIAQDFMDQHYASSPYTTPLTIPTIPTSYTMAVNSLGPNADGLYKITITVSYRHGTRSVELVALVP